jgi:tRNA nucleotidyltransferase (CCA-adding enzyme)
MAGKDAFEVTTYRIDGTYEDGRHPDSVTFTASLAEDLKRRDFTINALAYNPKDGLVDLFDGTGDMQRKVIRAVGDPQERFSEDALRIMRAVRFSAQLGYSIDAGTREAIEKHAPDLRRISAERIHAELTKLLVSPHPDELRTLYETGISAVILPELDRCMSVPQNNPHHRYTVGEHIIHSVTAVRADETLRYTMLFHDLGKAACRTTDENGIDHFYGHAEISADLAYRIMRRLKFDNATADRVYTLVKYHGLEIAETPRGVRRAAVRVGADLFPLLFEVKLADAAAQSEYHAEEKRRGVAAVRQIYEEILSEKNCLSLKELAVSGSDLIAAGMKPGKGIGEVLRIMLEDVLETPEHNEKQYLLEKYRNMVENGCKTR